MEINGILNACYQPLSTTTGYGGLQTTSPTHIASTPALTGEEQGIWNRVFDPATNRLRVVIS